MGDGGMAGRRLAANVAERRQCLARRCAVERSRAHPLYHTTLSMAVQSCRSGSPLRLDFRGAISHGLVRVRT